MGELLIGCGREMEQTPVILMSATPPSQTKERADLVLLEKPFEMETLVDLVRRLLES